YEDLAQRFAGGDIFFGHETLWFAPLYPVALGMLRAIGVSFGAAILLQHALGVGTAVLAVILGRKCGSRFAGTFAGFLLAVLPTAIYAESRLLYTGPLVLVTAAFLVAFVSACDSESMRRSLWAGLLLGAAGLFRANMLVFAPLGLWILYRARSAAAAMIFVCGIGLTLLPVLLRNGFVAGEWTAGTANGGMILATAFAPDAKGGRALERTPEDFGPGGAFQREAEQALGRELSLGEAAKYHERRTIEWIRAHPDDARRITAKKLELLASAREIDDNMSFTLGRNRSAILSWMPWPWAIVMIPAAVGTAAALRRRDAAALRMRTLVWFSFAVAATLLVFFVTSRYRLPLIVAAAVLAGFGIERFIRAVRTPQWIDVALFAIVAAISAWATLRDPGVKADPAFEMVAVGAAFERRGDPQSSLHATEEALRLNPNIAGAWHNRALALLDLGKDAEALQSLEEALRLDPALGAAWQTKGVILARAGRVGEAIEPFRRAVKLLGGNAAALENLARALGETGRCAEALEVGRQALAAGSKEMGAELGHWEECARRGGDEPPPQS
ncbi:MAG TPA: tetratricopeptide repeat protein, partial [bacterium]|nr:tetratricopeptide repeat protein [bacterium]